MPSLFSPIQVGPCPLKHRVVLAPLTRIRGTLDTNVPQNPMMKEYYAQRGSVPGTLLITEATFIAAKAGLYRGVPGIYSDEQIAAWKEITDAVHANGSYIFLQLWALGRAADVDALHAHDPSFPYVSSSDIPLSDSKHLLPRPLTKEEIQEYVQLYAKAASNAVHRAGFDGVEIHGANGYLIDQFTQDVCNKRTDEYGGSVENRCRFALEVAKAVTDAVGEEKTGIRIGPWTPFQDMCMDNPIPTFTYLATELKSRFPKFAYLHVIEARVSGGSTTPESKDGSNDFLRDIWLPRPLISAGNYDRESAIKCAEQKEGQLVAFGRYFISNPDLPKRLEKNIPLTPYNRSTFYIPGDTTGKGYTDYPFADEAKF
ncbi:NADH:flavin oxidoreductase/NADH oxidase [Dendrothele bispora CBS 962.96]|uniref:NADH:flavin oxidoreductase/NADH oxidase n=1 Tax=Dendrothele bispora (strain CBS 962.96) TaxID=1314807 RepID=A0A4S8L1I0_DENBC|nr:NADH:flavin oxidoreductase/NADH oxidase [Dendrothele bispora CBS 962.96]